ncbi:ABC transporter permease [Pseudoalteromonas sp. L23]|uniref:Transport permease protein n=1 Tax=Pseudoalteromonas piscicida TaxID=43662 RepID=A0ABN5CFV3_PSEO7|nr:MULTISPECIES: ABC transporter permease [Pseudoalteromonas]ATD06206.1 ABC-2 type transport system permease protein [Pseudoalteromonas piscicida]MCF7513204.1 ABC transporter permease [Pseudoalteromonas sp. L7]MCF7525244.1 ABC transporter permease [Pseudoalteromonas sp. L23]MCG7540046.1 ABC transporter permease [Pseudoalteromonas sp. OF7H-1]MCX2765670.1 ABC transporter permease [Pseudoalteromonas sp. B530]
MLSLRRLNAIVSKEFMQLARDRITFAMIVMLPLAQLLLFGYAINTDVRHVSAGIVDFSQTYQSRQLIQTAANTQVVDFIGYYDSIAAAEQAITRGKVNTVLVIPADFVRRQLNRDYQLSGYKVGNSTAQHSVAQWLIDGSDPLLSGAVAGLSKLPISIKRLPMPALPDPAFALQNYFNPEKRSSVNIIPGLIAIILTMTMILFTSSALVREREQGNMEFLITTPVRPTELMLGKILPYILVGFIQMAIILFLGHWLFDVPLNFDMPSLLIVTLLFITASLTLGLLISTKAKNQLQAMQMTVFVLLPAILLSGFMFPFAAMPRAAQYLAEILPATHYVRSIRAVVLRGAHFSDLYFDLLCLVAFSVIGFMIATMRFKKRLD